MDKTALVEAVVDEGGNLIRALDDAGFPVRSALWKYNPDQDEWRLIIATPLVDTDGPLDAYKKLDRILEANRPDLGLALPDIQLLSPKDRLIQLFRSAVQTGKSISDIRFSRNVINGVYIDDALVYRST